MRELMEVANLIGRLGTIVAVVVSYSAHHHIGWSALHGLFGWFYVIYFYATS
jgi:hypothetical protein